ERGRTLRLRRPGCRACVGLLIALAGLRPGRAAVAAEIPPWLPRYDLDVRLDVQEHRAIVRQRVTWTNRHQRPASELVFNAHSHFQMPDGEIGFYAKMMEILRMQAGEALYAGEPPLEIAKVRLLSHSSLDIGHLQAAAIRD